MKAAIKNFLLGIVDIVFPIECLGCGFEGEWLCQKCARSLAIYENNRCPACHADSQYGKYCSECAKDRELCGILVAGNYKNKLLEKSIKTLKYRFASSVARELAGLLAGFFYEQQKKILFLNTAAENVPKIIIDLQNVILVPVPLHKKRKRWRGFNQAEILAEEFLTKIDLAYDKDSLRRLRYTKPQAGLSGDERRENLRGSFVWEGKELDEKYIILVDDVATTGSTLEECAKVLKKAGAREVWGLVVAKG